MAAEAWARGSVPWEEAVAFSGDMDSILSGDGAMGECHGSLTLGELRGLHASDDDDSPRILHLNSRLEDYWSRRPELEMNTCFRMQRGKAQRCDVTPYKDDDPGVVRAPQGLNPFYFD
ncbi:hypothetical protein QYE76_004472 [Lolium multiflorum]|uniref:Uncharacterized protein n=1 Tax=Lolium multiflorum TaxID=4521 RepID=A0AAD8RSL5_LOLMU|nr:hypothetical protein QYE76_004472 [Lolium multiflorum]